jgi:hypothetical protein
MNLVFFVAVQHQTPFPRIKAVSTIWIFVCVVLNLNFTLFLSSFLLLYWEHIVAFTKVLTIYQIYHTWIHPLYPCPLSSPLPYSWKTWIFIGCRAHPSLEKPKKPRCIICSCPATKHGYPDFLKILWDNQHHYLHSLVFRFVLLWKFISLKIKQK